MTEPENRRCHEMYSYARTSRLYDILAERITPTRADMRELFSTYAEGERENGAEPTLAAFAWWITEGRCEVTW
jgi:hypothetical protein